MDKSRCEIFPGVWLDYRRAVFLEQESILCVADLHLGYAWAHRYHGQMLPIHTPDPLLERLLELCSYYKPKTFAFLGDIVHKAVPVSEIENEFVALVDRLSRECGLKLILGNHDKNLKKLKCSQGIEFVDSLQSGKYLLIHGNSASHASRNSLTLMGHEHPAISLGDGVSSSRFPCFLTSKRLIILPAFSLWAAGTNIRCYDFMSPIAQAAKFEKAIAILGAKLLPVPLHSC